MKNVKHESKFNSVRYGNATILETLSEKITAKVSVNGIYENVEGTVEGTVVSQMETFVDGEGMTAVVFQDAYDSTIEFSLDAEFIMTKEQALAFVSENKTVWFEGVVEHDSDFVGHSDFSFAQKNPRTKFNGFSIEPSGDFFGTDFSFEISDDAICVLDCSVGLNFTESAKELKKSVESNVGSDGKVRVLLSMKYDAEDFGTLTKVRFEKV